MINSIVFSPDGSKVATASEDETARIWDTATGTELHRLKHDDSVGSVVFSPDGNKVATADDHAASIWDIATDSVIYKLPSNSISLVVFSYDGSRLAGASGFYGQIKVWDTKTGAMLYDLEDINSINSIVFGPDGTNLLTASDFGYASIWDISNGKSAYVLKHSDNSSIFSAVLARKDAKWLQLAMTEPLESGMQLRELNCIG